MPILSISDFFYQLFQDPAELFDPEKLIRFGGLAVLILLTFSQTGLFFCFFLPGDAILFMAGVFIATRDFHQNIIVVCIFLVIAAFLGNMTGYYIGRTAGPLLLKREDSWFFKKKFLITAEAFYKKYGALALTLGMFFIVVRTFAPIVAGMIRLHSRRMALYSFTGAIMWVNTLVLSGYFLGRIPFVEKYLEYFILGLIVCLVLPVVIRFMISSRKQKQPLP